MEKANYSCEHALAPFVSTLFNAVTERDDRQVVIVCFGTTAISGDALGPMVGTLLTDKYDIPAFVYGTQENNVNGKNMKDWLSFIKTVHEGAIFVAVDASLGKKDKVGEVVIREDGVCPSGVTGKTKRFGDIGILGIVAQNHGDALMQLLTVSPLNVSALADKIAILIKKRRLNTRTARQDDGCLHLLTIKIFAIYIAYTFLIDYNIEYHKSAYAHTHR